MVDFKQIVENNKELIIKKTKELVQIPSVLDETTISEDVNFSETGKNVEILNTFNISCIWMVD